MEGETVGMTEEDADLVSWTESFEKFKLAKERAKSDPANAASHTAEATKHQQKMRELRTKHNWIDIAEALVVRADKIKVAYAKPTLTQT